MYLLVLNEISWYCSWKTDGSRSSWGLGVMGSRSSWGSGVMGSRGKRSCCGEGLTMVVAGLGV